MVMVEIFGVEQIFTDIIVKGQNTNWHTKYFP